MEGVWRRVIGRKNISAEKKGWDILRKEVEVVRREVLTFFITDFGDSWCARDLFLEIKDLGLIEEIVIPPKRDWRGHRFGFFRFINVADEKLLETKLDNVWLDGSKMSANISRIKRKNQLINPNHVKTETLVKNRNSYKGFSTVNIVSNSHLASKVGGGVGKSITYAEITKGEKVTKTEETNEAHLSLFFTSNEEEKRRFSKAKVGVTRRAGDAYSVANSLLEEGIFTITATALGPNLCLLEENEEGDLATLIQEGGVWLNFWFAEVREWKKTDAECARVAHCCTPKFAHPILVYN